MFWKRKGDRANLFLVHRIDSATSGVLIASTCPQLAIQLKGILQSGSLKKLILRSLIITELP